MQAPSSAAKSDARSRCVALIGLALLIGGLAADVLHQITKERMGASLTYYYAGGAFRKGINPYVKHHGTYAYIYPPLYAFICQPLSRLSAPSAARVLLMINTGCILAALLLGARTMLRRLGGKVNAANILGVALFAALVVVIPIHNEMRGMETNAVLLLSFILALVWIDDHPILCGLALAVAINIKYLPVVALPYLLLRRRWLAATAMVFWSIAVAMLPATTLGWSTNLAYLHTALGGLLHLTGVSPVEGSAAVQTTDVLTSISITSALARQATRAGWPKMVEMVLIAAVAGSWVGGILLGYRQRKLPILLWPRAKEQQAAPFLTMTAMEWTALVTFALAFSPNSQNRNLVLAVVPATLAAVVLWVYSAPIPRALAWMAAFLMAIGLVLPVASMGKPFTVFWMAGGWPCWCLLMASFILTWGALLCIGRGRKARQMPHASARPDTTIGGLHPQIISLPITPAR